MAFQRLCVLTLGVALLPLFLAAGCGKTEAACQSSAECDTGFVCSSEGACVSASADASVPESDAAPACPETTHFCAEPVPADWTGPVAGTQAGFGETPAACAGDYGTQASVVGEEPQAQGACGCSCSGNATGADCGNASFTERDICVACGAVETCINHQVPSDNVCRSVPGTLADGNNLRIFYGRVTDSGTCTPAAVTNDLSSFFASDERYCSASPIAGSCESGGSCLPVVSDVEFTAMCIFRSGDQECPAGYPAKESRFESVADTRACAACSCDGPAIDNVCAGGLSIGPSCGGTVVTSPTSCITNPVAADGSTSARYAPDLDISCSLTGGEQTGEVVGASPVTFCCTEAIAAPVLN